ncbi:MAG: hypothetical protein Q4G37_02010 [Bifidobacterium sp.]|nr:hypothetical protein [Bifidobacterium sp.]
MTPQLVITIVSVFLGFILFTASFAAFMYKKSPAVVWTLFGVAIVCMTIVPVMLAVFHAALTPS